MREATIMYWFRNDTVEQNNSVVPATRDSQNFLKYKILKFIRKILYNLSIFNKKRVVEASTVRGD